MGVVVFVPEAMYGFAVDAGTWAGQMRAEGADVDAALTRFAASSSEFVPALPAHGDAVSEIGERIALLGEGVGLLAAAAEQADREGVALFDLLQLGPDGLSRAPISPELAELIRVGAGSVDLAGVVGDLADPGESFVDHPGFRGPLALWGSALVSSAVPASGTFLVAHAEAWVLRQQRAVHAALRTVPTRFGATLSEVWTGQPSHAVERVRASVFARYAPALGRLGATADDALDVMSNGRGVVRTTGRVLAPLAVVLDARTAFLGSSYDGARGTTDRIVAGASAVGGAALLASSAGLITLGVVAAPLAVAAVAVGVVWGVSNLVVDNWDSIEQGVESVVEGAGDVIEGAGDVLGGAADAIGGLFG